jgi:hypothetical protein
MTVTPYLIPLVSTPQTLSIVLGGVQYNLRVLWNSAAGCWVLDINDSNNNPIVSGVAIVTGTDLLSQFAYLNFGGQLIAETDFDTLAVPTADNLGAEGNLYFVVVTP